jgi:hypothetical protein
MVTSGLSVRELPSWAGRIQRWVSPRAQTSAGGGVLGGGGLPGGVGLLHGDGLFVGLADGVGPSTPFGPVGRRLADPRRLACEVLVAARVSSVLDWGPCGTR